MTRPTEDDDGYAFIRKAYGIDIRVGQRVRLKFEDPGVKGLEGEVLCPGASSQHIHVAVEGRSEILHVHPLSVEILTESEGRQS